MENTSSESKMVNKHSLFIDYSCIRNLPYLILKYFKENKLIQEALKDFINFEPIINVSDETLYKISMIRNHQNILETVPKNKKYNLNIDTASSLKDILKSSFKEIIDIDNSEFAYHSMCYMIFNIMPMEFCNNIYIYYEDPIMDIVMDLIEIYGEHENIKFVHGKFEDIIYNLGECDLFILDDYKHLQFMKDHKMLFGKEFTLSDYAFNLSDYTDSLKAKVDIDEEKETCKFNLYSPMNVYTIKKEG